MRLIAQTSHSSDPHANQLVFAGNVGYRCSRRHSSCGCCVILQQKAGLDPCNWELTGIALEKGQKGLHGHVLPFPSKNSKDHPLTPPLHKVDTDFNPNAVPSLTFLLCGLSPPVLPSREGMGNSVCPVLETSSHVNEG